jgi:hypothetical protein
MSKNLLFVVSPGHEGEVDELIELLSRGDNPCTYEFSSNRETALDRLNKSGIDLVHFPSILLPRGSERPSPENCFDYLHSRHPNDRDLAIAAGFEVVYKTRELGLPVVVQETYDALINLKLRESGVVIYNSLTENAYAQAQKIQGILGLPAI